MRAGGPGIISNKTDHFVFENMPVGGDGLFFNHPITRIVFLSGDEVNAGVGPPGKEGIVGVTSIDSEDRTFGKDKVSGNIDFVNCSFGLTEPSPVKKSTTQLND